MDNNLEENNVSSLYGYKYNGVYYIYFNDKFSEYENLGKNIIIELHNINAEKIEKIKSKMNNFNKKTFESNSKYGFFGVESTVYSPSQSYFIEISLWEPTVSEKAQYIYIMDLDSDALVVKHSWETKTIKFIDIRNLWSGRFGYVSPF